jgi:hypothetical protein
MKSFKILVAISFLLCFSAILVSAKDKRGSAVKIMARMSFENQEPADMLQQQVGGKSYLYVQLAGDQGIKVVDVGKPKSPRIVSEMPVSGAARQMALTGNAGLMSSQPIEPSPRSSDEVTFWDLSDPKNPQIVQRFTQVVRVLEDNRGYTYVLNRDGLWVVRDSRGTSNAASVTDDASLYGGGG